MRLAMSLALSHDVPRHAAGKSAARAGPPYRLKKKRWRAAALPRRDRLRNRGDGAR